MSSCSDRGKEPTISRSCAAQQHGDLFFLDIWKKSGRLVWSHMSLTNTINWFIFYTIMNSLIRDFDEWGSSVQSRKNKTRHIYVSVACESGFYSSVSIFLCLPHILNLRSPYNTNVTQIVLPLNLVQKLQFRHPDVVMTVFFEYNLYELSMTTRWRSPLQMLKTTVLLYTFVCEVCAFLLIRCGGGGGGGGGRVVLF